MLRVIILGVIMMSVIMLSVMMLSVMMLSVLMSSVIRLSVVAPYKLTVKILSHFLLENISRMSNIKKKDFLFHQRKKMLFA
jgi:hypothetical protein